MRTRVRPTSRTIVCTVAFLLCTIGTVGAMDTVVSYPVMAPVEQYREANATEEIALSRSAAPPSISGDATILVLGDHGYETAVKGKDGFVCVVERSWANTFDDAEFWNPRLRAPICFNAVAARTVLPAYLRRTEWVLAGASKAEMLERYRAELAANRIGTPESGAMSFMMSKQGYLGDLAGHWHSHLMVYLTPADGAEWGANLHGSPVFAARTDQDPFVTLFITVPTWSDGTHAIMDVL